MPFHFIPKQFLKAASVFYLSWRQSELLTLVWRRMFNQPSWTHCYDILSIVTKIVHLCNIIREEFILSSLLPKGFHKLSFQSCKCACTYSVELGIGLLPVHSYSCDIGLPDFVFKSCYCRLCESTPVTFEMTPWTNLSH